MKIINLLLTPIVKTTYLLNSISAKIITFTIVNLVFKNHSDQIKKKLK